MPDPLWINDDPAAPGTVSYDAGELRRAMALALMYGGNTLDGKDGVRPGGNQLQTTLTGSTITVAPGVCALSPRLTATQGTYWVALPDPQTFTLTPADATNARRDLVIIRVYDHDIDASGMRRAWAEYIPGVAAPSPVTPAVPTGAIRSAVIDVPKVGGGAPVVTDLRHYTVAAGGVLPVTDSVVRPATTAYRGQLAYRLDAGTVEANNGGGSAGWETIADPALFRPWTAYNPVWSSSAVAPVLGNGTLTGRYRVVGKTMDVNITLTWGSTTDATGAGTWRFSLPAQPRGGGVLTAIVNDSSAGARYAGAVMVFGTATGDNMRIIVQTADGGIASNNRPMVWAAADQLFLQGTLEIV